MVALQSIVGIALVAFGASMVGMNFVSVYLYLRHGAHRSMHPLLGGACVVAGCGLLAGWHWWILVPLVVDPGCLYTVVGGLYAVLARWGANGCRGTTS